MAQQHRNRRHQAFTLDPVLTAMLRALSVVTDVPRARMVDAALRPALASRVASLTVEQRVAFDAAMAAKQAEMAVTDG